LYERRETERRGSTLNRIINTFPQAHHTMFIL
jgi:hypothetical protein